MKEFDNLESFLEHVIAIPTSIDNDWDGEKTNLMTISSKGLEFDTVFLPGWEEGLFHIKNQLMKKGKKVLRRKEDLHMLE